MSHDTLDIDLADRIATELSAQGWCVIDGLLGSELTEALALECLALAQSDALRPARIGRAQGSQHHTGIRSDRTLWLEPGQSHAQTDYLWWCEQLRTLLNRQLFLGLRDSEAHFAHYAPGAFYARHRDRFSDDDHRVLSSVCYLNKVWDASDGGALRLYLNGPDHAHLDIQPEFGRAVFFLSADFEHEVLPAKRDRYSIATWFRTR